MKTRFTWLGIVATLLITISTFFVACNKDDMNDVIVYHGQVVYINTTNPFPDLTVKVTNGNDTHCQTQTDAGGNFSLKVRVNEIDGSYYLLAGDETCVPKKVALGGYGQAEVDLGVVEVEGPALPTVKTTPLTEVTAESATLGGEVMTDGRLAVTARGICYGTEQQPTVEGLHTTDGAGLGSFTTTLKNLEHNTILYARAYATNKMGTAYGDQVKFTTELGVPIVISDSVYRITAHSAKCKGHVESDGGYAVTKKGTCWSRQPDPTVDDECTNDGSGKGEFTSTLNNLLENTTYYVRTYATNATATVYGEQIIITTLDGLAEVKTDSVNNITATGFTAFGTVVSDCDIPVTARGFCYSTSQYPTIEDEHTTVGKGLGSFQGNIRNLNVGTIYYVRAYATNATATTYGEQIVVKTLDGLPTVETNTETIATSTTITSGGIILDDGGYNITARGVCYSTTNSNPTIADQFTTAGTGTGSFTTVITSVSVSTIYYVRAYATNSIGTSYGEIITVKTGDGLPIIEIIPVKENITDTTIHTGGYIIDDGGYAITSRGICWSEFPYPTINNNFTEAGTGTGYFYSQISNVNVKNKSYYIRAYATNENGTVYSEQEIVTPELWKYVNFPTISYGGYVYKLGEFIGRMDYQSAMLMSRNYQYAGFSDWFVPEAPVLVEFMKFVREGWGVQLVDEEDQQCGKITGPQISGLACSQGSNYSAVINCPVGKYAYYSYLEGPIMSATNVINGGEDDYYAFWWIVVKDGACGGQSDSYYYHHEPFSPLCYGAEQLSLVRLVRKYKIGQ